MLVTRLGRVIAIPSPQMLHGGKPGLGEMGSGDCSEGEEVTGVCVNGAPVTGASELTCAQAHGSATNAAKNGQNASSIKPLRPLV